MTVLLCVLLCAFAALVTFGEAATRSWIIDLSAPASPGIRDGVLAEPGLPALPYRDLTIALPDGMRPIGLRVTPLETAAAELPDLTPVPVPFSSEGRPGRAAEEFHGAAYPSEWGRLLGHSVWHGVTLAHVRIHPLRVRGGAGDWNDAEAAARVRIELELAPLTGPRVTPLRPVAGEGLDARLRGAVINPEDVVAPVSVTVADKLQLSGGFAPTSLPTLDGSTVEFLIITSAELVPNFQVLADYKTERGIPTVVRSVEWILENYHRGEDSPATIRTFLQEAYAKWGTRFVLLGGDVEVVPVRHVHNSFYPQDEGSDIPVDLFYGGLDGDWNADGDQTPGESWSNTSDTGDAVDFAAELHVGRAPIKTAGEADVFVGKVLAFERDAVGDHYENLLFMSEVLFPQNYSQGQAIDDDGASYSEDLIVSILADKAVQNTRYYEAYTHWPGTLPETRDAVVAAMNTGDYGFVNHVGHGFFYVMSVGDHSLVLTDASTLTNAPHFFVLNNLNCASAAFDYNSIMERFVTNPLGGAVLAIGSSRAAFPPPASAFQKAFYEAVFNQGAPTAGEALTDCRAVFVADSQENTLERWTQMTLVMIGDPTLQMWTAAPAPLAVSAPAELGLGSQTVEVTVTREGLPLAGARVCLAKTDDLYDVAFTGPDGVAHLEVLARSPGAVSMNVSAPNSYPWTGTLAVNGGGQPYLSLESLLVYDDGTYESAGNGDGLLDAGETVAILATFRNSGDADLPTYTQVDFMAGAEGVEPLVEACGVAPLAVGQTAQGDEPFLLVLDQDLADRTEILCTLQTTDGGVTGRDEFPIEILAPDMKIGVITWNDFPHGNSNGIAEANEEIRVSFSLRNDGWGSTSGLTGWLETGTPGVTVFDGDGFWPDLTRKTELDQIDEFRLSMTQISPNTRARLHIVDARGREWVHDFDLDGPAQIQVDSAWAPGAGMAELLWSVGNAPDLLGHHVYRSLSPNFGYERRTAIPVLGGFFVDDGLEPLTRYYYKVAAIDSSGMQSRLSAGWGVNTLPAEAPAFPLAIGAETSSHVAVGDVDGDGTKEVVISADGVYVWRRDGTELRDGDGNPATLGAFTALGDDWSVAGVALANLTGDPGLEIVATCRTTRQIHVYEHDGGEAPGWPKTLQYWNWATPACGDVDGDGDLEVAVTDIHGRTYIWHHDGTELLDGDADPSTDGVFHQRESEWYQYASPTLADLDGDGAAEVLLPTRHTSGTEPDVLHALNAAGEDLPGWPYVFGTWKPSLCSAAVGDLDGDGVVEIVTVSEDEKLHCIGPDGIVRTGFPKYFVSNNSQYSIPCPSPAFGDLDNDGRLDIVAVSVTSAYESKVYAYTLGGTVISGWPRVLPGNSECSPIVGDVTGDGRPDVIFGIGGGTDSSPNTIYAFYHHGYDVPGFPFSLGGPVRSSPMLTDLDDDGLTDLVYGGWDLALHVWNLRQPYDPLAMPWPTHCGGASRSGAWQLDDPSTTVELPAAARRLVLHRNTPNPFNPRTEIAYDLPAGFAGRVQLAVYDVAGRVVRRLVDREQTAGRQSVVWDGRDDGGRAAASGVYLYRIRAGDETAVDRMLLVR